MCGCDQINRSFYFIPCRRYTCRHSRRRNFKGKTEAGPHGDFIAEMDQIVGELMATLEQTGVADETLVIFSSDNGPEVLTTVHMRQDHGHDPARPWRGMKRDNWEGGHRVPLIVRWPGNVPAMSESEEPTSLTDLMATCAAITGAELPTMRAEDSFNMLPIWRGEPQTEPVRPFVLGQTISLVVVDSCRSMETARSSGVWRKQLRTKRDAAPPLA